MISKRSAKAFCRDDISLIENYYKAIADKTQTWHCHHRRETIFSRKDLIEIGEYYNRPACELIFLTKTEHMRLHNLGKSAWNNGKYLSAETRKKMSEARKGKHPSAETRKKLSESRKGKHHSAETRKKMSESKKGKNHWTKGTHWYNNGIKCIKAKTCPEGFVPGRLK